jgi:hypothetical protein
VLLGVRHRDRKLSVSFVRFRAPLVAAIILNATEFQEGQNPHHAGH